LTNIKLPYRLQRIGHFALENAKITEFEIQETLTEIGSGAFHGTSLQGDLIIPEHVTTMGINVFSETNITSVTWNTSAAIADYTFSDCPSLENVTINGKITSMGDNAFYSSPVKTLILNVATPPTIRYNSLDDDLTAIYVPAGAVETYKAADEWKEYADIIQAIPTE